MVVRTETERDHAAVHTVNTRAFGRPEEAQLVDVLRRRTHPHVSLVAEDNDEIVGHILFTPVSLADYDGLIMGLAPMAVVPSRQRMGIGSALVQAGLEHCGKIEAAAAVVLGHPSFYPKFGFFPASAFGLSCEYDVPAESFMARELRVGALRSASGTVSYDAAFGEI